MGLSHWGFFYFMDPSKYKPDKTDIVLILGLLLLGGGIWTVKPWLAMVTVGSVLVIFGIIDSLFGRRR